MNLLCGLVLATLFGGAELLSCSCADDEECITADAALRCQCNSTKYEGATYLDLAPTLTCNADVMTISVSKCLLENINRNPSASYLLDTSCTANNSSVLNGSRVYSIQTQPNNATCGTTREVNSTHVTYWNVLRIPPTEAGSSTTTQLSVVYSCTYTLDMQTGHPTVLLPAEDTINLAVENSGSAPTTMKAYSDPSYTMPIDKKLEGIAVGTTLYFGITTEFADVQVFVLRTETCYASPTHDPDHPQRVRLMMGGCQAIEDISTTVDSNGDSLEVRFSVDVFAFQGFTQLHIICDVRLCDRSGGQHCTGCSMMRSGDLGPGSGTLSLGPFKFTADDVSSCSHTVVSWAVMGGSLLALLCLRLM